ncbi:MAG: sulfatase-like hydrolase/transferase [Acidobacteriota bacterium]
MGARRVAAALTWACLAALAATAGCGTPSAPRGAHGLAAGAMRGANVLLVTIDTLRHDRLGAYGGPAGLTPTLDRLSAAGVRYSKAFSHVPMTLPAHASILTGRTPVGHGVHGNGAFRLGDDLPTLATVLKAAGYRTGAFVGAFVLDARFGLNRGFDDYDDHYPHGTSTSFAFAERRGDAVVEAAGTWILDAREHGPWLAWVHLFDPHAPYDAPAEFRPGRTPYDAEVAYADAMLGRLLDSLAAAHALDHTLVVVTADHGESLGEHGEATHGLFAYDATLAVPLLVSGAGIAPAVVDGPVGHADILPTVLDLVGVAAPAGLGGQSLVTPPPADRAIYFEALDAHLARDWAPLSGVATAQWKYIDLPLPELYDLAGDPHEIANLVATDPARVAALARDRARLAAAPGASAPAATIDAAAERRLRSLGYTAAAPAPAAARAPRRYGPGDDPKRLVALNERFTTALDAFNRGRADEALATFSAVLAERPDFLVARTSAASVLMATRRASAAVTLLRAAPPAQAERPDLLAKLGVAEREAGDVRGAVVTLERARAAGYGNPELLNDLGVTYARLGRVNEARAVFKELLARDATAADAWNNLGVLELGAGHADDAAAAFRQTVAVDPSRGDAWQGLGAVLIERDPVAGIEAWRRAERLQPRDYDLLFNLGMALANSPRPAEAKPYLERFQREAPRERYTADVARVTRVLETLR